MVVFVTSVFEIIHSVHPTDTKLMGEVDQQLQDKITDFLDVLWCEELVVNFFV